MRKYLFILFLPAACVSPEKKEAVKPVHIKDTVKPEAATKDIPVAGTAYIDTVEKPETERGLLQNNWAKDNPAHPVFHSRRVDLWASKNQAAPAPGMMVDHYIHDYLDRKQLEQLNVRELIYYCLAYPASYSQNCGMPPPEDKTKTPKIIGRIYGLDLGATISKLQLEHLSKHRDSVIAVFKETMQEYPSKIHPEYFYLLRKLKAIEAIPTVVQTASMANRANYTFLLLMMEESRYAPFRKTPMRYTLYGDQSWEYGSRIEANEKNCAQITRLAMDMYKEWAGK